MNSTLNACTIGLLLNGPNLNLLGQREPERYGRETLANIEARLSARSQAAGVALECLQTNWEGAMLERIHQVMTAPVRFILINPGAWTHTSIALRDALLAVRSPLFEIHISQVYQREPFRQHS